MRRLAFFVVAHLLDLLAHTVVVILLGLLLALVLPLPAAFLISLAVVSLYRGYRVASRGDDQ